MFLFFNCFLKNFILCVSTKNPVRKNRALRLSPAQGVCFHHSRLTVSRDQCERACPWRGSPREKIVYVEGKLWFILCLVYLHTVGTVTMRLPPFLLKRMTAFMAESMSPPESFNSADVLSLMASTQEDKIK